jgi:hypothetical protein
LLPGNAHIKLNVSRTQWCSADASSTARLTTMRSSCSP